MGCLTDPQLVATPLHARLDCAHDAEPFVVQLTSNSDEPVRSNRALLVRSNHTPLPPGYGAYFCFDHRQTLPPVYSMPAELAYLDDGDVIRINPRQAQVWVMYRRHSQFNALLLT